MMILEDPKRLAKLLASINVSHADRPFTPIEAAEAIRDMLSDLGGDMQELRNRLPLSNDMIMAFQRVLSLPSQIYDIVVWGKSKGDASNNGEISFSVAHFLARLEDKEEILKLVSATLDMSRPVTKDEIKSIVSLRRRSPDKTIYECMREVINVTQPIIIHDFLFISGIDPLLVESLKEYSQQCGKETDQGALALLSPVFPRDSVKDVKVRDDQIRVMLSKQGHEFIGTYAGANNLSRKSVINHIISKGLSNDTR